MRCRPDFRRLAERQGIERPFGILSRMPPEARRLVADVLRCSLGSSTDPEEQAWRILNQSLRGLQARTHSLQAQLTPFSRNHTWWEIVARVARWVGIHVHPDLTDDELERLVFERLADMFVQRNLRTEAEVLDALASANVDFDRALRHLRLGQNGARAVWSALVMATVRADQGLREGAWKLGEWLCVGLRWAWPAPLTIGLRMLQQRTAGIYHAWASRGFLGRPQQNSERVCTALAVILFQDMVERSLDEVETLRS
jgi:hypothetical protein